MYFHDEEHKFDYLEDASGRRYSPVIMEFAEGDIYECSFSTSWESDNGLEEDSLNYEEYWEELYDVVKVIKRGPNLAFSKSANGAKEPILLITYRNFPVRVETPDGALLYPPA